MTSSGKDGGGAVSSEVRLRAEQAGDEDVLYRARADLDSWEQLSPQPPLPWSREQFRARLAERAADDRTRAEFVIEAAGTPVGSVSLFGADPLARHAEVGMALAAEYRGRGYGTAALTHLVEFGFERWNLHRLHLVVLASNAAGRRVYEKVGFVEEGRLREHAWIRGRWDDEIRMGLLRAEWRAAREHR